MQHCYNRKVLILLFHYSIPFHPSTVLIPSVIRDTQVFVLLLLLMIMSMLCHKGPIILAMVRLPICLAVAHVWELLSIEELLPVLVVELLISIVTQNSQDNFKLQCISGTTLLSMCYSAWSAISIDASCNLCLLV